VIAILDKETTRWREKPPTVLIRIERVLQLIDSDDWQGLVDLATADDPVFFDLWAIAQQAQANEQARQAAERQTIAAQERQAAEAIVEKAQKAAAQRAVIDALTAKERLKGLKTWGLKDVMTDAKEPNFTPAMKILLDRMKPAFEAGRLSDKLITVYKELKTSYETPDGANRKLISDIFHYKGTLVPWPNATTRQ
jgi:hypothetical protein